jgi:hypothetical protein
VIFFSRFSCFSLISIAAQSLDEDELVAHLREAYRLLPSANYALLKALIILLANISQYSSENKMVRFPFALRRESEFVDR